MRLPPFRLLLLAGLAACALPAAAARVEYRIDPAHSAVNFSLSHLGIARTTGRLSVASGRIDLDPANIADSRADVALDAASVDTGLPERDRHLRSSEFFDVAAFPTIRFVSQHASGDQVNFVLEGDLTLRGVTQPVRFIVRKLAEGRDPWGGYRSGYQATATISRKAFGMGFMAGAVGDEVSISVDIEAIRGP